MKSHKSSYLKEWACTTSHFWKSEVWNGSHWANIKVSARLCSFWRLRRKSVLLPFLASESCLCFLAPGLWFHLQSIAASSSPLPSPFSPPPLPRTSLSYKDPCAYLGPTWIIQATFSISISLVKSHLQNPFCHKRQKHIHRFWDDQVIDIFGGIILINSYYQRKWCWSKDFISFLFRACPGTFPVRWVCFHLSKRWDAQDHRGQGKGQIFCEPWVSSHAILELLLLVSPFPWQTLTLAPQNGLLFSINSVFWFF